jgi:tetratricopeptide (TPR) repeat protein
VSDSKSAIIDFPILVQTLSNQGRTGLLYIGSDDKQRQFRIAFQNGQICGSEANDGFTLYHALRWIGLLTPERYVESGVPSEDALDDLSLAHYLLERNVITKDGIRDAIECLIEERAIAIITKLNQPTLNFREDEEFSHWLVYQAELGINLGNGGLIMEGVRIQDEIGRLGGISFRDDDLYIHAETSGEFDPQAPESILFLGWRNRETVATNLRNSGLPPSTANLAFLSVINQRLLRRASVAELVIMADQLKDAGMDREREQVLRQAVQMGANNPRLFLQLAYLAESRKDYRLAADDNLRGGLALVHQNPKVAAKALTKAREFGAERLECLQGMLACYKSQDDVQGSCTILLQMADCHEGDGHIEDAIDAVREAQELGADPVACALSLAKLQMNTEDPLNAVMQLQSAAHLALQDHRTDAAVNAWEKILQLQPGNLEVSLLLAQHLSKSRQQAEAVDLIHKALSATATDRINEQVVALRELLAKLDTTDHQNHQILAHIYQKQQDVNNAVEQLQLVAKSYESDGNWAELAKVLKRILDIDQNRLRERVQLAQVLVRIGYTKASAEAWNQAVHSALSRGKTNDARDFCEEALEQHPGHAELHAQLAAISFREANQRKAVAHYQRAAFLALGQEDRGMAKIMLNQLVALKPDDLFLRQQLAHICILDRDEQSEDNLRALIRTAMRTNNLGIALEHAYQRVLIAKSPGFEPRSELVEMLRRAGRHEEELDEGESLFHDLLAEGEFHQALALQQRLVASNSENGNQVRNLGEVFEALGDRRQAVRCYRHAATLFQQEGRIDDTKDMLVRLAELTSSSPDVQRAQRYCDKGLAINWDAIRSELAAKHKKQIMTSATESGRNAALTRRHRRASGEGSTSTTRS